MLCRNCHRENDDFASECSYCGSEIKPDYRYLISEVLNNNNKANEALYNATYKSVYFIASKLSNVMQNPDNVVAKSYDTALQNLDVLTNKSNFPRWINSIAATIIISGMRKQRPDFLEDVGGQAYPYEFPYEDYRPVMRRLYSSQQTVSAAANFIYKLTDEEKLFYLMYYYNEMTSQEISRVFRISPSTVSYHISTLNQKLRDELIASPLTDTSPLACLAFAKLGLERQFEEVFPKKRNASARHEQQSGNFYDKTQLMPNMAQEHRRERPANAGYTTQMRAQQGAPQQHRQQPPRRPQQQKNSGGDTASKLRLALVLSACAVIIIAAIIITLVLFKKENYDNVPTYDSDYGSEPIEIIVPTTESATEEVTESLDRERPDFDTIRQEDDAELLMSYAEDFIMADSEEAIGCYYILDIDYDGGMELIIREDIDDDNYRHEVYDITSDGDVNCSNTLKSSDKSYYMLREIERHDGEGNDYEFIKVGKTGKIYSHSLDDDVEDVLLEEYDEDDFFCGSDEHDPRTVYVLYSDGSDDEIEVEVPTEPETEEETEEETEKPEDEKEEDDSDKATATVKVNDSLKLRNSPDTSSDSNILAKMPNGAKVELIDETKFSENGTDWYFVRYTDKEGKTHEGYAAADYIKVN